VQFARTEGKVAAYDDHRNGRLMDETA